MENGHPGSRPDLDSRQTFGTCFVTQLRRDGTVVSTPVHDLRVVSKDHSDYARAYQDAKREAAQSAQNVRGRVAFFEKKGL